MVVGGGGFLLPPTYFWPHHIPTHSLVLRVTVLYPWEPGRTVPYVYSVGLIVDVGGNLERGNSSGEERKVGKEEGDCSNSSCSALLCTGAHSLLS